jgi:hypothetical protein
VALARRAGAAPYRNLKKSRYAAGSNQQAVSSRPILI